MALPRLSKEEKYRIVEALLDANQTMEYPGFNNNAVRRGPYVNMSCWAPVMDEHPDFVMDGPGPVIVDTRDYSVQFCGSLPEDVPVWLQDDSLERGRVKLAPGPIVAEGVDVSSDGEGWDGNGGRKGVRSFVCEALI